MAFGSFVRKNLSPSLLAAAGAMIGVWGFGSDAYEMWTAGLKPEFLQLSGFVVFAVGVVSVLYRQHLNIEERLSAAPLAPSPVVAAAPSAEAFTPQPSEQAVPPPEPRRTDRQYTPGHFVRRYVEFLQQPHTDLQHDGFLRPHVGQWIVLTGSVGSVAERDRGVRVRLHVGPTGSGTAWVYFGSQWTSQLAALSPGDAIRAEAQIEDSATYRDVRLTSAELL